MAQELHADTGYGKRGQNGWVLVKPGQENGTEVLLYENCPMTLRSEEIIEGDPWVLIEIGHADKMEVIKDGTFSQ